MKRKSNPETTHPFRYILAGVIIVSITLAMLAISQFILTGKIQIFSFTLIG